MKWTIFISFLFLLASGTSEETVNFSSDDRQILNKIYANTNGGSWTTNSKGWKDPEETRCGSNVWSDTLSCDVNGTITEIRLNATGLTSLNLPFDLFFELFQLKVLILDDNNLSGPLPLLPPSLEVFSAKNNRFNGDVYSEVGQNDKNNLVLVDLRSNRLSGTFPDLNITRNFTLLLDYNSLSGFVTAELKGNESGSLVLSARSCGLNGGLPSALFTSSFHLVSLDLTSNLLFGFLPTSFSHPESVLRLLLSYNELDGVISSSFASLINLKRLELSHNSFSRVESFNLSMSLMGDSADSGCSAQYNRIQCLPPGTNFGSICSDWSIGVGTGVSSSYYLFMPEDLFVPATKRSTTMEISLTIGPSPSSSSTSGKKRMSTEIQSKRQNSGTIRVYITGHLLNKGAEIKIAGVLCSNVSVESTTLSGDNSISCSMKWNYGEIPLRLDSSLFVVGQSCSSNTVQFVTTSVVCIDQVFCPSCLGATSVPYDVNSLLDYLTRVHNQTCGSDDFDRIVTFIAKNRVVTRVQCNLLVNLSLDFPLLQPPSFCLDNNDTINYILDSGKRLNQQSRTAILSFIGNATQSLQPASFFSFIRRVVLSILQEKQQETVNVNLYLEVPITLFSESNFLTSLDHIGVSLERVQNFTFFNATSNTDQTLVSFDVSNSRVASGSLTPSQLVSNLQKAILSNAFALGYPTKGIEISGGTTYVSESSTFSLSVSRYSITTRSLSLKFGQSFTGVYLPASALTSSVAVVMEQYARNPFKILDPATTLLSGIVGVSVLDSNFNRKEVNGLTNLINISIPLVNNAPLVNGKALECLHWDEDNSFWSSDGCIPTIFSTYVVCSCNHLTNFSLGYSVPRPTSVPTPSQPTQTSSINFLAASISIPIVFVTVAIIVILFILWNVKRKKEKFEKKKDNLIQMDSLESEKVRFIEAGSIERHEKVGNGAYSNVWRGNYGVGASVAMKQLISEKHEMHFSREASIISKLNHPNVVQYIGLYSDLEGNKFIVFEYLKGGSILEFIRRKGLNPTNLPSILNQLCDALVYLENQQIVHGDVSCRNILIQNLEDENELTIKLIDFGMARHQGSFDTATADEEQLAVRWAAPEIMKGTRNWSNKSDVWSFGIVLWEMFNDGQVPYSNLDNAQVVSQVRDYGKRLAFKEGTPNNIKECAVSCWMMNPQDRPTFALIASMLCSGTKSVLRDDSLEEVSVYVGSNGKYSDSSWPTRV
eukprot:TRINITY_DN6557_c0_g1_i1.p1 TRINITY_DN6557_c0_g1~~TRINITY_DN6557_c0_g1_i1.p1  ORF type:complete len:1221 (+),score=342.31 TRINITY_DN6557_c0_g1_i1:196-3858(+)